MVMDNLHLICGNCGCNREWLFEVCDDYNKYPDDLQTHVYIHCQNCGTLHPLDKYAGEIK